MWRHQISELEVTKANQVPVGRFFLIEDDDDGGSLRLFASVRDAQAPHRFVAVGLTGRSAFHVYLDWSATPCLLLPISSDELFLRIGSAPKADRINIRLGRLMFPMDAPPYFCASWDAPGLEVRTWATICTKTWMLQDIRISRPATDDWELAYKDQAGNWASLCSGQ